MVLATLPAGTGRHAAPAAQQHRKLPAPFPGHLPVTESNQKLFKTHNKYTTQKNHQI